MRYFLALLALATASSSFGTLRVPQTVLSPEDLEELGLILEARNINELVPILEAPLNFTLSANDNSNCTLDDVYVFVKDNLENTIYGSSVAPRGGLYSFQLESSYSQFSTITIVCLNEATSGDNYMIELRDYVQSP